MTAPYRGPVTARQLQALRLAANGNSSAAIGRAMGISLHTVNCMLQDAYRRLGAEERCNAVAICMARGLILPGEITIPGRATGVAA